MRQGIKISERISDYRRRMRVSQETLARQLGVSARTVYRWETGRTIPKGLYLKALKLIIG